MVERLLDALTATDHKIADKESRRVRLSDGRIRVLPPIGHGEAWSGGVRGWNHG